MDTHSPAFFPGNVALLDHRCVRPENATAKEKVRRQVRERLDTLKGPDDLFRYVEEAYAGDPVVLSLLEMARGRDANTELTWEDLE